VLDILRRLTAGLDRLTCAACVVLFGAIFVTMIAQILCRYVVNAPLVWTEELARYLYIWAVYLGAAVALRRGNHIVVTLVAERLPPTTARVVTLGGQALALFFLVELAVQGIRLAARVHTVSAITLPIPWSAIYAAAPVAAGLMILQTIETAWTGVRGPARRP
jgi:TRAP-type transport system small permease protein